MFRFMFFITLLSSTSYANQGYLKSYVEQHNIPDDSYIFKDINSDGELDGITLKSDAITLLTSDNGSYLIKEYQFVPGHVGLIKEHDWLKYNSSDFGLWFSEKNGVESGVFFKPTYGGLKATFGYFKIVKNDPFGNFEQKTALINPASFDIGDNDIYDLMDLAPFFKNEDYSIQPKYAEQVIELYGVSQNNLAEYSDTAMYLQKYGHYNEALILLGGIIKKYPSRSISYLEIGDSYWALNDIHKAREYYDIYMRKMDGNMDDVPQRVFDRISDKS